MVESSLMTIVYLRDLCTLANTIRSICTHYMPSPGLEHNEILSYVAH